MAKPKKPVRTKEQLQAEQKRLVEVSRQRKLVKEQFWPLLVASSDDVDDAQSFLGSLTSLIMQKSMELLKERTFGDLDLGKFMDPKNPHHEDLMKLINLFKNEPVFVVRDIVEGMKREIDMFVHNELKTRPLSSLKADFM